MDHRKANSEGIKKCHPLSRKHLPPSAEEEILERTHVGTSRLLITVEEDEAKRHVHVKKNPS